MPLGGESHLDYYFGLHNSAKYKFAQRFPRFSTHPCMCSSCFMMDADSQSQLLERLHGVQRRAGVPLQNLHLVSVPHQRAANQFVQQGLLGQVHFVLVLPAASQFILLGQNVACTGGETPRETIIRKSGKKKS